jgi:hypothetical protein
VFVHWVRYRLGFRQGTRNSVAIVKAPRLFFALLAVALLADCSRGPALEGMWAATVTVGSTHVPFQYLISGQGMATQVR